MLIICTDATRHTCNYVTLSDGDVYPDGNKARAIPQEEVAYITDDDGEED